jgi:hypothetical protein
VHVGHAVLGARGGRREHGRRGAVVAQVVCAQRRRAPRGDERGGSERRRGRVGGADRALAREVLRVAARGEREQLREPVREVLGDVLARGSRREQEAEAAQVAGQRVARAVVHDGALAQQDDVVKERDRLGRRLEQRNDDAEALLARARAQRLDDVEGDGRVEARRDLVER